MAEHSRPPSPTSSLAGDRGGNSIIGSLRGELLSVQRARRPVQWMQLQLGIVTYYGGGARSGRDRGRSEQEDGGAARDREAEAAEAGAEAGGGSGED